MNSEIDSTRRKSPAWALESVKTEMFPIQYGPGKGTVERLPMPWDRLYLNRWFAFLKLVSERYSNSRVFRVRRAINKGMRPNKAGRIANYLEIYKPAVVADEM
jgi:hypothetical protein